MKERQVKGLKTGYISVYPLSILLIISSNEPQSYFKNMRKRHFVKQENVEKGKSDEQKGKKGQQSQHLCPLFQVLCNI
ncbi:MAG: hypothetical protein IKA75_10660 [Bacteroidaceae bacterium]|nr:hypothetical protein [Bacteroidaceae bacterium]